jgi:hypothetical protein
LRQRHLASNTGSHTGTRGGVPALGLPPPAGAAQRKSLLSHMEEGRQRTTLGGGDGEVVRWRPVDSPIATEQPFALVANARLAQRMCLKAVQPDLSQPEAGKYGATSHVPRPTMPDYARCGSTIAAPLTMGILGRH